MRFSKIFLKWIYLLILHTHSGEKYEFLLCLPFYYDQQKFKKKILALLSELLNMIGIVYNYSHVCHPKEKIITVISALQAATLFEADLKYRPQIGRRDINTGRI